MSSWLATTAPAAPWAEASASLAELKADPGQLGLETMLKEIAKLERVRAVGLPPDLFADTSEKLLAGGPS